MRLGLSQLIDSRLQPLIGPTRAFYEQRGTGRGPADWTELQATRASLSRPASSNPRPRVEWIDAGDHSLEIRIHEPLAEPRGVLLNLHGGGFYVGSAAASDVRNRDLADALGIVVIGVDYRLAPEHPWRAAPDDCETAAVWITEQAAERFGTSRLVIGGFSAGSTLAMTTLLRLRDRGLTPFSGAVLQFGTYDLSGQTPSGRLIADEYFLDAYAGALADRTHPDFSPIYAKLSGLPTALIVIGEEDILLGDNLAMAGQLAAYGVEVDLRIYPAAPHGFTGHPTPMGDAALDDVKTWLGERLDEPQEQKQRESN
ncbi:alpha/beta hydrolase [Naasia lichenicola]|uniref:Alpha/beta hydrolase n=1 Tax=Naasia lichenicola TaxID=2565933 RepID=A0A4S4FU29_9MICO|nr:alpha/beta hydrolase [Naasia lichenicola]THG33295.1 alpha/beta hydrolase [Naasia lichenicola]